MNIYRDSKILYADNPLLQQNKMRTIIKIYEYLVGTTHSEIYHKEILPSTTRIIQASSLCVIS